MSKSTYPLKLPLSIKKAAQRLAKEDGVSLNQWIAVAVAEKVGVVETAADFFKKRAGKATGEGLIRFLRTAPKAAPDAEDTLGEPHPKSPPKRSLDGAPSGFQMIAIGRATRRLGRHY
jgi:hypothetical protein